MQTSKQKRKCPHCSKGKLTTRARRPLLVKATLFWLPLKLYECNSCYKKTYIYGSIDDHTGKVDGRKLSEAKR